MAQFEFLKSSLFSEKKDLPKKLHWKIKNQIVIVKLNELLADEIKDWASEKLQLIGFDKNYETTPEGKILENLIDVFHL